MLHLGPRTYQLVRGSSGFHVIIDPHQHDIWQQVWRLEMRFVPDETDSGPENHLSWEYWRLWVNPMGFYRTTDWRELAQFALADDAVADHVTFNANMQNPLHLFAGEHPARGVFVGDYRCIRRDGYLFTVEKDGEIEAGGDEAEPEPAGEFHLRVELPFASASVAVPLNTADMVAAARGIAAREIGLRESVRPKVTPYDPKHWVGRYGTRGKHSVELETPWRVPPAS